MADERCVMSMWVTDGVSHRLVTMPYCVKFTFDKDLYRCYTRAMGTFYSPAPADFTADMVIKIFLRINGVVRHVGIADSVTLSPCGSGYTLSFSSRGFTLLLAQNEPYPRINQNVDLKSLIERNLDISDITCENDTPVVNYIYVKERSTIWEAVAAYAIKAMGHYPYIRSHNKVSVSYDVGNTVSLEGVRLTAQSSALSTADLLSDVHMMDIDDTYSYEYHDSEAGKYGIVRSRYYPLDNQWLYSPVRGLQAKTDYSRRGQKVRSLTYQGCLNEDLMDTVTNCGAMTGMRVNAVRVTGDRRGMFTTVKAYIDGYGQIS